ncbi:hypothetical protein [Brevibacillus brevis]|uniref:hypothetical protein n=1 Tax=Brevibacillus brevis TaxID=1393 RepID=UPI0007D8C35E|nr:hypothetical protein [Brevibacillus brevis]
MNYSLEQYNFIQARECFETINNQVEQIVIERKLRNMCNTRKEYGEKLREIQNSLGYTAALSNMVECEQKLMDWAHDVVKRDPKYRNHKKEMDNLFEKYYFNNEIKNKMIDLALRLELSTNTLV